MPRTHFHHPGQLLLTEFLEPMNIRPGTLAREIGVDRARIKAIVDGERDITADTALRLARFLGTTAEFWMNAQTHYDLAVAAAEARANRTLSGIRPHRPVSAAA